MPMRQRAGARLTALLAALGAAVMFLTAVPAQAAADHTAEPPTHTQVAAPGINAITATSRVELCTDPYFHLGGLFYCGGPYSLTGESWYAFPNGALQVFVIGTDHAVWTRWSDPRRTRWSPWTSMGGSGWSAVYIYANRYNPTIYVRGPHGGWWHRTRLNNGVWTPWRQ